MLGVVENLNNAFKNIGFFIKTHKEGKSRGLHTKRPNAKGQNTKA
jgi:hypothetical protein